MICQKCGNGIPLKDTVIVEFLGKHLPLYSFHIACYDCANRLYEDCLKHFPEPLVESCLHIYFAVTDEKSLKK